ncbi:MAG TPA: hypothetical protein VLL52_22990, partial [Anaerolineae bacterium]|nr:hypothetical protein [Anaerolineae bacterium]
MMMQERNSRQQVGGGGLYDGDRRSESVSFGNDNVQDPLDKDKSSLGGGGGGATKPGVQFCSSHDAVSAKIAAFDGKGGPTAHQPQIEIAPGIMARLRGAKETWECGTCVFLCVGADVMGTRMPGRNEPVHHVASLLTLLF